PRARRSACWRPPSPGCTGPSWRLNYRRRRASSAAGSSLGHAAEDLADPPALLLRERPGLLDQHPVAHPALVGLVVRLQLLRRPDHALVARMAEHPLDPHHARLLHRVRHDHAFTTLPLTHGMRPSSRGAQCWPAPDLFWPGSAARGSWPSPSRAGT